MTIAYTTDNGYIELPINTTTGSITGTYADNLIQNSLAAIAQQLPGWQPSESHIEVLLLEQMAAMVAEAATVASSVPLAIFSYMGTLVGITPQQGSFSTAQTTWTMIDNAGYSVPGGTIVGYNILGNQIYQFQTVSTFTVPPGSTSTASGAILIQSLLIGDQYDNLDPLTYPFLTLISSLSYVVSVAPTTTTAGGTSVETTTAYLDRLSNELQLLAPRPILPQDYASMARNVTGVARAAAYSGVNPYANILSVVDSSFSTGVGGWLATTNSTLTSAVGSHSSNVLKITAGAAVTTCGAISSAYAVAQQQTYLAIAEFDVASAARSAFIGINCYDVNGTLIGSPFTSTAFFDSMTLYSFAFKSFTTPANTHTAKVYVTFTSPANGETHQVARVSLMCMDAPTNYVADSSLKHVAEAFSWTGITSSVPPTNLPLVAFSTGINAFQYTGGSGVNTSSATSQRVFVPAGVYTVSAYIDATYCTGASPSFAVCNDFGTPVLSLLQTPGTAGVKTGSYTVASGGATLRFLFSVNSSTVAAGQTLTFATPQMSLSTLPTTYTTGPSYGTPGLVTNNERMMTVVAVDDNGSPLSSATEANIASYLESLREVNFLVNVVGPIYTGIQVHWEGVTTAGGNPTTVTSAANQALVNYLDPANWAGGDNSPPVWDVAQNSVFYLSIVTLLGDTPGLDHLTNVLIGYKGQAVNGTIDLALPGPGPLPTITIGDISGGAV